MEESWCLPLIPNQSDRRGFQQGQGIAKFHHALSTVFYDLVSLADGLHLTMDPRTEGLPLQRCCVTLVGPRSPYPAVPGMGLSSPCHTSAVALEDTGNQRPSRAC